jgi:RNA polymerase sigma-70 factor (ECF subfamily)
VVNNDIQEDSKLIQLARQGDRKAFAKIVSKYEALVASIVVGMVGNNEDAEDVGQNVFIRFYNALDDFRGEAALSTYLTRIAINLSLNEIKRRQRKSSVVFRFKQVDHGKEIDFSDDNNAENKYDVNQLVSVALQELEPKFRAVVVLRMVQGYTTEETAGLLKIPLGTVLSRLSRAQDRLKILLKQLMK